MDRAMRMNKVVRVVVLEQRREPDAFNVKISVRQKAGAPGAQGRTNAFATVPVRIHRERFLSANLVFWLHGAERKGVDQLLVKFRRQLVRARDIKAKPSRQIKVAPDHSAWRPDNGKLGKQIRSQNVHSLRESHAVFGKLFRLDSKAAKHQSVLRPPARGKFGGRRPGFRGQISSRAPEAARGDRFGAAGNGQKHFLFVTRLPNCFLRPPSPPPPPPGCPSWDPGSGYCPEPPFF